MFSHSPGLYASYKKPPQNLRRPFTSDTTRHDRHNMDGLIGRGLMTSEYGQKGDQPKRRKSKRRQA